MFITLEGGEGAGKSTQIKFIESYLTSKDIKFITTREPGGTKISENIRSLVINNEMEVITEILLMFAARAEHVNKVIKPALEKNYWVICDRFIDSSYAYQGYGKGFDLKKIEILENLVLENLKPDLTIVLDVSLENGLKRIRTRNNLDKFETESLDFFRKINYGFRERAYKDLSRYRIIDANQSIEYVETQIKYLLNSLSNF